MSNATKTDVRPGDVIRVYQKIPASAGTSTFAKASADKTAGKREGRKTQIFEGRVLARKHGSEPGATITVRKEISGLGVERIFPLHSPIIEKIEVIKRGKVRRAKLYYLRKAAGQQAKIKER